MNEVNQNNLIPTGDYLRQLIGQSKVKEVDLKNILRSRGVFTGSDDKASLGSLIIKTGISPSEYIELKDNYRDKEESPKYKTKTIAWNSEENLINSVPDKIDLEKLLDDQFGVYKISHATDFTVVNGNPNHLVLNFKIRRNDLIKNFGDNFVENTGGLEIKKEDDKDFLMISTMHTAKETLQLTDRCTSSLIKHFKDEGHVQMQEAVKEIFFSDFTNINRISFLNDLVGYTDSSIGFQDTTHVHFSPDHTSGSLPSNIAWMKDKIEDTRISGQSLHATFILNDKNYHDSIKLYGVQCSYNFYINDCNDTCKILLEFSNYKNLDESELILNILMLKIDSKSDTVNKENVKKSILESFEKRKMDLYDKYATDKV